MGVCPTPYKSFMHTKITPNRKNKMSINHPSVTEMKTTVVSRVMTPSITHLSTNGRKSFRHCEGPSWTSPSTTTLRRTWGERVDRGSGFPSEVSLIRTSDIGRRQARSRTFQVSLLRIGLSQIMGYRSRLPILFIGIKLCPLFSCSRPSPSGSSLTGW